MYQLRQGSNETIVCEVEHKNCETNLNPRDKIILILSLSLALHTNPYKNVKAYCYKNQNKKYNNFKHKMFYWCLIN